MVPVAAMFTYDVKEKDRNKKNEFYWKLYGRTHYSKFSKYVYQEKGVLSEKPYLKPTDSTIIVKIDDAHPLRLFFRKYKAVFTENIIILDPKGAKSLGLSHPSRWQKIVKDLKGSPNLLVTVDF